MSPVFGNQSGWDNAASEENVVHGSDTLGLVLGPDGFEEYTDYTDPPGWTEVDGNLRVVPNRAFEGSNSLEVNESSVFGVIAYTEDFEANPYPTFQFAYEEASFSNEGYIRILDSNGDEIGFFGTNNPEVEATDNGTLTEFYDGGGSDYYYYRRFTVTLDWSNNQYDVLWEDLTGPRPDQSVSNYGFTNNASELARVEIYKDSFSDINMNFDNIYTKRAKSGNIITSSSSVKSQSMSEIISINDTRNLHNIKSLSLNSLISLSTDISSKISSTISETISTQHEYLSFGGTSILRLSESVGTTGGKTRSTHDLSADLQGDSENLYFIRIRQGTENDALTNSYIDSVTYDSSTNMLSWDGQLNNETVEVTVYEFTGSGNNTAPDGSPYDNSSTVTLSSTLEYHSTSATFKRTIDEVVGAVEEGIRNKI